jgi:TolB protein
MLPICLFLGLLFLAGCGQDTKSPASPAQPEGPTYADTTRVSVFADTSLEAAVRTALQKPTGPLTQSDLESLTQLAARNRGIARLAGIDALKNLAVLDLADNQIQDLSPLAVLTSLTHLDLESNRVRDLSALAALRLLQTLNLSFNAIQDLSPLLGLASLKTLEVSGNPLTDQSRRQHLPGLQGKGVQVTYAVEPETPEPAGPAALPLLRFAFRAIPPNGYRYNLFVGQTDGSTPFDLLPENADFGTPEWSPDGSLLVFVSNRDDPLRSSWQIYAINADGTGLRQLTQEARTYSGLRWSPDGSHIAFAVRYGFFDADGQKTDLYVMDAGGGELRRLTRSKAQDGDLCWSPDGTRIAFIRWVTPMPEQSGGMYTVDPSSAYSDIYTIHPSGSDSLRLTGTSGYYESLSWSPDGARIVFEAASSWVEQDDICVMNADGTGLANLTQHPSDEWAPAWSPDGAEILFCSTRASAGGDFFAMSADGSNVRKLSEGFAYELRSGSPSWSPDRSMAGFISKEQSSAALYVWDRASSQVLNVSGDLRVESYDSRIVWAPR